MILIENKRDCCGCEACIQVCPQQCIQTTLDDEGFLYPIADASRCIQCSLCDRVCPVLHQGEAREPLATFAAKHNQEEIREESSSGGAFTALAEQVIRQGGVVFGAVFNENYEVVHATSSTLEELSAMRGSKYVQSRIYNVFRQVLTFLQDERQVLFSGTPCQMAGLKNFLRRDYDNLLLVDVACHGVPSPGVWRQYLKEVMCKQKSKIQAISFRSKVINWKNFSFIIQGEYPIVNQPFYKNPYMKCFLSNLTLRPSCYACPSKEGRSGCDLTIADYWGVDQEMPDYDDNRGVSLVLAYTAKGEARLNAANLDLHPTDYLRAVHYNPALVASVAIPTGRDQLFKNISQTSIIKAMNAATHRPLYRRIIGRLARMVKQLCAKL